jgi:hypothetical protein
MPHEGAPRGRILDAMNRAWVVSGLVTMGLSATASAHFALQAPAAYSMQDSLGLPEKSAPCGQADPSSPVVPTNAVTAYHAGDTITVTINELIFHPGHYRVALAADQASLPADPVVTADSNSACGSAQIEDSSTTGVLIDNQLPHTTQFSGPQSFQVTLPAGMTCASCTLQVVEFMGDHPLNNPGGCFYHHCAQVAIAAPGAPLDGGSVVKPKSGGCDVGSAGAGGAVFVVGLLAARRRPRRRR